MTQSNPEDPWADPEQTVVNLDDSPWEEPTASEKEKESAPAKTSRSGNARSSTMALNGRALDPTEFDEPSFPVWNEHDQRYKLLLEYVPDEQEIDITDVTAVNQEILLARRRLFRIQRALTDANRRASEAKFEYKRKRSRILIGLSGGTDKSREAAADIACEEEYSVQLVTEQVALDVLNQSRAIKAELDSLANLSHNIRAQMAIR